MCHHLRLIKHAFWLGLPTCLLASASHGGGHALVAFQLCVLHFSSLSLPQF
jgi:hypothetical protein